jgi:hypothetical protein
MALKWWYEAAMRGHATAQFLIGQHYEELNTTAAKPNPQNTLEAIKWYVKSAAAGDAYAEVDLAMIYQWGHYGVPKDCKKAASLYAAAAVQAQSDAENNLGTLFFYGCGVKQDYARAIAWISDAAKHGNFSAQENLGKIYEYGAGAPQSYATALNWYLKAAQGPQGDLIFPQIGEFYYLGKGVEKNYARAYYWFSLSGYPVFEHDKIIAERTDAAAHLTPVQLADIQSRARYWSPRTPRLMPP